MEESLSADVRLQDLFKLTWDACLVFDMDWQLVVMNSAAVRLFGYGSQSAQGLHFRKLMKKRVGSLFFEARKGLEQAGAFRSEAIAVKADGETLSVIVKGSYYQLGQNHWVVVLVRKPSLETVSQDQAVMKTLSYKVGAGQVATGILHNIGNILNSINISIQNLSEMAKNSKIPKLLKANALFHENKARIGQYIYEDKAGRHLPDFYSGIGEFMKHDNDRMNDELEELKNHLKLVKELIGSQQSYARCFTGKQEASVKELLNDVLKIEKMSIMKHQIRVDIQCPDDAVIFVDRSKALHVLVNLLKNGRDAMVAANSEGHFIIKAELKNNSMMITIKDNGVGLNAEQASKLFSFGFTTKLDGHGFGLFTCLQLMEEMDGKIYVTSEGLGTGATFHCEFPIGRS